MRLLYEEHNCQIQAYNLHLVRLFWNHVLTCASVILSVLASAERSPDARYFCRWNRFSSSIICSRENDVRGFLRFGGVLFWYGCPILLPVPASTSSHDSLVISYTARDKHSLLYLKSVIEAYMYFRTQQAWSASLRRSLSGIEPQ